METPVRRTPVGAAPPGGPGTPAGKDEAAVHFCGALGKLLRRPGDTTDELQAKVFWCVFQIGAVVMGVLATLTHAHEGPVTSILRFGFLPLAVLFLGYLILAKRLSQVMIAAQVGVLAVGLSLRDLSYAGFLIRIWPLFVVLIDVLLLVGAHRHTVLGLFLYVCLFLSVMQVETWLRFGLFDIPGMAPAEERRAFLCDCEHPPCAQDGPVAMSYLVVQLFVFAMDFKLTRRFAEHARAEKAQLARGIEACEFVAASLADFDLSGAQQFLDEHYHTIPPDLVKSFHALLANLASYRPYLPQSLLCHYPMDDLASRLRRKRQESGPLHDNQGTAVLRLGSSQQMIDVDLISPSVHIRDDVASPSVHIRDGVAAHFVFEEGDEEGDGAGPDASLFEFICGADVFGAKRANYIERADVTLAHVVLDGMNALQTKEFVAQHEMMTLSVLAVAETFQGVVDSFTGDSFAVSFNATRACGAHAEHGMKTLHALADTAVAKDLTAGGVLVTGSVNVGVLGSSEMRRPCCFGHAQHTVEVLETLRRVRKYSWLCSEATHELVKAAQCEAPEMRIVLDRVYASEEGNAACADARSFSQAMVIYRLQLPTLFKHPTSSSRPAPGGLSADALGTYNYAGRTFITTGNLNRALRVFEEGDGALRRAFAADLQYCATVEVSPRVIPEDLGGSTDPTTDTVSMELSSE